MIQPAAPAASTALSLGVAAQAGQAEDAGNTGDFALLLASTVTGESAPATPAIGKADPILPADAVAGRQANGKVAGKILPGALPVVADLIASDATETHTDATETPSTNIEADETPATATPLSATGIILLPVTLPTIEAPKEGTGEDGTTRAAPAAVPNASAKADKPAPEPAAVQMQAPVQVSAQSKAESAPALIAALTLATEARPAEARPAEAKRAETKPAEIAPQPAAEAAGAAAVRIAIAPARSTASRVAPKEEAAETTGKSASAGVSTAETLRQRPARSGDVAPVSTPATAPQRNATANADRPAADAAAPVASELQPLIALRDAAASQSAPGTGPAAPAALAERGHDFAALVDRLVEARDAAMPQTVRAAINHAEFGQVSLRFDQGDTGLTVAMTSTDPDFARAVQAAAPSGQAATTSDNGSSSNSGQRQDGLYQQSAGTASGQPQAQSQSSARDGQAGQPRDEAARTATGRRARADENEQPGTARDGIYA